MLMSAASGSPGRERTLSAIAISSVGLGLLLIGMVALSSPATDTDASIAAAQVFCDGEGQNIDALRASLAIGGVEISPSQIGSLQVGYDRPWSIRWLCVLTLDPNHLIVGSWHPPTWD